MPQVESDLASWAGKDVHIGYMNGWDIFIRWSKEQPSEGNLKAQCRWWNDVLHVSHYHQIPIHAKRRKLQELLETMFSGHGGKIISGGEQDA